MTAKRTLEVVEASLGDDKAEDVVVLDLAEKTSIADYMVIATARSQRHAASVADKLSRRLKAAGLGSVPAEGLPQADWVLLDAGDVIVHIFRPEVRTFYGLEKMWGQRLPAADEGAELIA